MTAPKAKVRRVGIALRTALLLWLVILVTLLVFLAFIIPLQKVSFLENLESKARGVSASLQDITAGAVVSEDYGTVVEHCRQVLTDDNSIDFLVVTRNDGFSLIVESGGHSAQPSPPSLRPEPRWRQETLDRHWRPALRTAIGGIEMVPLFQKNAFHYARPFDYSGIEWGWIHVGLSLDGYDASMNRVYQRTLLLALSFIAFSLLASLVYAKRMVRPILILQTAVQRLAQGELSARAEVHTGDELESLGGSFNAMADTLAQRNRILESVRFAAKEFLVVEDWKQIIDGVLERIGEAAQVSRAYLFRSSPGPDGNFQSSQIHEWLAPGITPLTVWSSPSGVEWKSAGFGNWEPLLQQGHIVSARFQESSDDVKQVLRASSVQSVIILPVMVAGEWWGFLGFDQCEYEREWSEADQDSFRAVSDMLGAAIERRIAQDALLEAKATLERRVRERTRELEEQVEAKERARTELADTQQRLMDLSRQAGMAEIATGVLHNIGNVLNSVNVSATIVASRLHGSRIDRLLAAVQLLQDNQEHLAAFVSEDPKGQRLLPYLGRLVHHFEEEQAELLKEVDVLTKSVEHIKEIVSVQQNYAKISGVIERLSVAGLMDDAVQVNQVGLDRLGIRVVREYEPMPSIYGDKHKILQILLNLVRNAKEALKNTENCERLIYLRIEKQGEDRVRIQVRDTGVGVHPEHLTRIFSHGFTTKRDGHGFGLHLGALTARQMGGSLSVESLGPGHGAVFTLELPMQSPTAELATQKYE